jgi:hypothetical protein
MNTQNGDEETTSVPMIVSPVTGSTSTDFTINWGSLRPRPPATRSRCRCCAGDDRLADDRDWLRSGR